MTVTRNINTLSKINSVHSCVNGYPSAPNRYSITLKMDRTMINALTAYSLWRLFFQGISAS